MRWPQLRGGSAPIARLVAIQNLGAMRQFQRGTVMTQAMGGVTQTLPLDAMPPPRAPALRRRRRADRAAAPAAADGDRRVRLRVGCRFEHDAVDDTPAVVMVEPHGHGGPRCSSSGSRPSRALAATHFDDLYGNRCRRLLLPPGASTFSYDAVYADLARARAGSRSAAIPSTASRTSRTSCCTGSCPAATASRTCCSRRHGSCSARTPPGAERVQAVCDWIHANVAYGVASIQTTTDDRDLRPPRRHVPRLRASRRDLLPRPRHPRPLRLRLHAGHRHPRPVPADGLPRLVRGLARRSLVDVRRALQHAAHRPASRSARVATPPTSP